MTHTESTRELTKLVDEQLTVGFCARRPHQRFRPARAGARSLSVCRVDAWSILGAACIGLGQYGDATEAFKQVVKLDKENVLGFNNLGVAYHRQGLLSEALPMISHTKVVET